MAAGGGLYDSPTLGGGGIIVLFMGIGAAPGWGAGGPSESILVVGVG